MKHLRIVIIGVLIALCACTSKPSKDKPETSDIEPQALSSSKATPEPSDNSKLFQLFMYREGAKSKIQPPQLRKFSPILIGCFSSYSNEIDYEAISTTITLNMTDEGNEVKSVDLAPQGDEVLACLERGAVKFDRPKAWKAGVYTLVLESQQAYDARASEMKPKQMPKPIQWKPTQPSGKKVMQ